MTAPKVVEGAAWAVLVAYWGLTLLGALGNRDWWLAVFLMLPVAYLAGRCFGSRRRARIHPATAPADRHERG